jgi:mercuric reductase
MIMTETRRIELDIQGMTCDSCALHVEKALKSVPGVQSATVPGWESRKAVALVDPELDIAKLEKAVAQAGYGAHLTKRQDAERDLFEPKAEVPDFDLMVIGGGSAGFAAAIRGAELGFRIALINAGTIGGTCVNVGCIPSKALIRAMEHYHRAGEHPFRGVQTARGTLNWGQVIAQKDELVAQLRQSKYVDVLSAYPNITLIEGQARLLGGNRVSVNGNTYAPGKIILATGASAWAPPIAGLQESGYLTSTTAMELRELPGSLIVLGANAVGLEQAQIFARAGVAVTLVEVMSRISPFEDEDISTALQSYLEAEGLQIVTGFHTEQVAYQNGQFTLNGHLDHEEMILSAERLLVATGRRPNTIGLGLGEAKINLGKRGEILVDENLRTSNPNLYAAGDVTGEDMFVYVAAYAGGLAAENALIGAGKSYEVDYIPRVTFTDPQIASAGMTEAQARQQGYEVKVSSLPMDYVPRAQAARDTRGLVKLIANAANDHLLGAHILAPEAGEMIQIAVLAIRFGLTVQQLRETVFPYLTNSEALKLATLAFEKDVAMLSCCAG